MDRVFGLAKQKKPIIAIFQIKQKRRGGKNIKGRVKKKLKILW